MKRFCAALILFTRLPLWRWVNPSQHDYEQAVVFWPLTGWITGGLTVLVMYGCSLLMPWLSAVVIGLLFRLLLTGALHEDGLADFCDGFGCGGSKEKILAVMKDSHIGTYGVIGLIIYNLLWISLLVSMEPVFAVCVLIGADPLAKLLAGQLTNLLPYARKETAKNGISYMRMHFGHLLFQAICGVIPLCLIARINVMLLFSTVFPVVALVLLVLLMKKKIGGYTGDCCGAAFLICELAMILGVTMLIYSGI